MTISKRNETEQNTNEYQFEMKYSNVQKLKATKQSQPHIHLKCFTTKYMPKSISI